MTEARTKGALTLANYPGDVIRVACDRCDRRGRYRRPSLVEQFGAGAALPNVHCGLANWQRARNASDPNGAHYPDLAAGIGAPD
jgi:hypothetical protein